MTITLPIDVVKALLSADSDTELEAAVESLARAYTVATGKSPWAPEVGDDTDEWSDLDPSELPRF